MKTGAAGVMVLALGLALAGCTADAGGDMTPVCTEHASGAWDPTCGGEVWDDAGNHMIVVCGDDWSAKCGGGLSILNSGAYCSANGPDSLTCPPGQAPSCAIIPCDGEWYGPGAEG